MPVLHLVVGPNGAGKSTYVARLLQPATHLPFVNADAIAAERWPQAQAEHAYEASRAAADERYRLLTAGRSFLTETVFSHPSKLDLVAQAAARAYIVHMHVILVPVEIAVARVAECVLDGGHTVPEHKIRERYARLWALVVRACSVADVMEFLDNGIARHPFRPAAIYEQGLLVGEPRWPAWAPPVLLT